MITVNNNNRHSIGVTINVRYMNRSHSRTNRCREDNRALLSLSSRLITFHVPLGTADIHLRSIRVVQLPRHKMFLHGIISR